MRITLDGDDVTDTIRTETCGAYASQVAAVGAVRAALLQRQRDYRQPPGLIADGRDMGTTVFPDAQAKIFLDASARVRAERRYKQLMEKGLGANLADLIADIEKRDERDRNRSVSPLRAAEDALVIDTSSLSIDEVVDCVVVYCRQRLGNVEL